MNATNTASSKLYQEGNYSCVATSKYGADVKHFVIEGGEKIRYFETIAMQKVAQKGWGAPIMHYLTSCWIFLLNHAPQIIFSPIITRKKCVANFIFSILTTSKVKLQYWRFNHRNLSLNIPSILPWNMSIMGQNRSGEFKAYWEIWFTFGRLLDIQAPRRVKQAWQGGIFTSPDLSRLVAPHVISFKYNTIRCGMRRHLLHLCYALRYGDLYVLYLC